MRRSGARLPKAAPQEHSGRSTSRSPALPVQLDEPAPDEFAVFLRQLLDPHGLDGPGPTPECVACGAIIRIDEDCAGALPRTYLVRAEATEGRPKRQGPVSCETGSCHVTGPVEAAEDHRASRVERRCREPSSSFVENSDARLNQPPPAVVVDVATVPGDLVEDERQAGRDVLALDAVYPARMACRQALGGLAQGRLVGPQLAVQPGPLVVGHVRPGQARSHPCGTVLGTCRPGTCPARLTLARREPTACTARGRASRAISC
jgi:hypothetical protein